MSVSIGQTAGPVSKSNSSVNWLSTENAEYGAPEFAQQLAGKLTELTSSTVGPAMGLHYENVSVAYTHLYGFDMEGVGANANQVTRSGDQGNVAELRIPATAAQLHKAWNIIVGPELTWSAVPSTTDFASEAKAITTRNALTYYWDHEKVGATLKGIAFEALAFAEGVAHIPWDPSLGKEVGVDDSDPERPRIVRSGDMRFTKIPTWDTLRDPNARNWDALGYIIVREWQNKYDRAALCDSAEKAQSCVAASATTPVGQNWIPFQFRYDSTSDLIPVYYLYAKRTPSVVAGRQTVFLEDGTILEDGPLDEAYVTQWPVVRMAAGEYAGTPWPYSKFFACLGAAQATDALYKDLLTNATAVSGQVLLVPDGGEDAAASINLSGGPQIVPCPKGSEPTLLKAQTSSPDHFNLVTKLRNEVQQIIGLDNLTAGEDIGANLSGAAMVMMTSTSVQNNSQLQSNWKDFVQSCGNVTLKHIQFHMTEPKRIALAGNARSSLVTTTEISGDSVKGIERVTCSIGSALQQTDAGKYEIATTALKEGWAQTPEQFQTVLDTGRLDALTQDLSNELMLINAEMEALARGESVPVAPYDNHVLHIKMERAVIASLTARMQPKVLAAVREHLDSHVAALKETDPFILQMLNQPVLGGGAEGEKVPPPGVNAPKELPPGMMPPGPAGIEAPQGVQKPQAPRDPRTNQPMGPTSGTAPPALAVAGAA